MGRHRFCNLVCLVSVGPAWGKWVTTNDPKFELCGTVCLDGFALALQFEGKLCFGLRHLWSHSSDSAISALPPSPFVIHHIPTALFLPSWAGPGRVTQTCKPKKRWPLMIAHPFLFSQSLFRLLPSYPWLNSGIVTLHYNIWKINFLLSVYDI